MNRSDFIKEIMGLYPHTFDINNHAQYSGWIKRYQQIPENWNFDKLMVIFSKKWNSTREAPAPSWFMQFKEDVKSETIKYKPEIICITPEEEERNVKMIKDFRKKIVKLTSQYKI